MAEKDITQIFRVCTICNETKELERFGAHNRSLCGRLHQCKTCCVASARKWRSLNPEKVKANNKVGHAKWRSENPLKRIPRETEDGRRCGTCQKRKPRSAFSIDWSSPDGLDQRCKECAAVKRREWIAKNPEKHNAKIAEYARRNRIRNKTKTKESVRKANLKNMYGMSLKEFDMRWALQEGKCEICKRIFAEDSREKMKRACVDHDHKTGTVRDLLCGRCNRAIGIFCDEPALVESALIYLRKHAP